MSDLIVLATAATTVPSVHYDCNIDKQFVVNNQGGTWNNS